MEQENHYQNHHSKFHGKIILVPFMVIVLILLSAYLVSLTRNSWEEFNYIGQSPEFEDQITIQGTGEVTVTPDIAKINVGVITEKDTVEAATRENTERMNNIISVLKVDFEIDEKDLKTSQYRISPKYSYENKQRNIVGYQVSQNLEVKVRNFDQIGNVISSSSYGGSNSISGPNFTIDDPEAYQAQAREKAIANAKEKAEVLVDQLGINLGPIVNYSEGSSGVPKYYYGYAESMSADMGIGGGEAPDIEAGSQEVSVTVNISYEIR